MSFLVDTYGTEKVDHAKLTQAVNEIFDMRPKAIIERLDLLKPIYSASSAYGHFGRDPGPNGEFSWEKVDLVDEIKALL